MRPIIILLVCVFFTLTTFGQVQQPIWKQNMETKPVPFFKSDVNSKGIHVLLEGSYEQELNDSNFNRVGADLIISYQVGSDFQIGGGIGVRMYDTIDTNVIPIFIDVRRTFFEGNTIRPYISGKLGYGLGKNGIFIEPSLGFMFGKNFFIGAGISVQKFKELETNSSAGMVKLGIKL